MAIVNTHYGFCAKGGAAVKFTYTGEYNVRDDGVVELLTSGTLVFLNPAVIDVFMVGGGGGGASPRAGISTAGGFGGGGGGYTVTERRRSVSGSYLVTIGDGGSAMNDGGATSFGTELSAPGGKSHQISESHNQRLAGSNGGSGGGGGVTSNSDYGTGGSDGSDGERGTGSMAGVPGGTGQGTTTREFGESSGKLYAGGGGGGRYESAASPVISMGGSGGGGSGAWYGVTNGVSQAATAGGANTGGGGGGGAQNADSFSRIGASGGSGIVCFRAAK